MSDERDAILGPVRRLYEESLAAHGTASQGVGWKDERSHRLRFEQLATLFVPGEGPVSVADLGCGYGAFHAFLKARGVRVDRFVGYDISAPMVAEARARHPDATFMVGDRITERVDYAFACGIFNVRLDVDEAAWRRHIFAALDNLAESAARGFAFNLLTDLVDWRDPKLFYADPAGFFRECRARYGRRVALLHDYPLYEWTMLVREPARRTP